MKFKNSSVYMIKICLFLLFINFFVGKATAQDSSKVEWMKVYFNMPGDISFAMPDNEANDEQNLVYTLIHLIDSAKFSIDLCVYDLEHPDLVHAIVRAKKRGLRVRIATDDGNRTDGRTLDEYFLAQLAQADIYSIDDDGDIYNPDGSISDTKKVNSGSDMHHKFAVIDHLSPDKNDDILWAGSTNMTWTGNFNTNVTIVIKDSGVAQAYLNEFEQMWGGSGDLPNQEKARFHKDKTLHSSYTYWVNSTKIEIYFSPWDSNRKKKLISERIVEVLKEQAQHDVKFSAFSITPGIAVSNALWELPDSKKVTLNGVISNDFYSRYRKANAIWASEESRKGLRMISESNELRKLHHKTIIIDAENPDSNDVAVTITGSYNFSTNADMSNDENLLIIYSNEIANQFLQDFKGIEKRAKQEWNVPIPDFFKDSLYATGKLRDANKLELEIVPGFGFPIKIAGIRSPWIWRGKDSTTYYATEALKFLGTLTKGKLVRISELTIDSSKATVSARFELPENGNKDLGLALVAEGFASTSYSNLLSNEELKIYKEAEKKAKNQRKGMWANPEKTWKVIPSNKKVDFNELAENPINLNVADIDEIRQLPGIGPSKAQAIIDYRELNGLFNSVDDLVKVKGFGAKTLSKLLPYITVEKEDEN